MARRRTTGSNEGDTEGYAVGYGKPPTQSRFRPGQSGNPAGRRKGVRNLKTDVMRTLMMPVKIKEGGRTQTRSTLEGILMVCREKALKGDPRALNLLLHLAQRFDSATELGPTEALADDDQAILDAYVAEVTGATTTPAATPSDGDPAVHPGNAPTKKARK